MPAATVTLMDYSVTCGCGRIIPVGPGSAGMRLECPCRRTVEVPSLHELRLAAGEVAVSADVVIETLLREGRLPEERDCVGCDLPTEDVSYAHVECARAEVRKPGWTLNPLWLLVGYLVFKREGEVQVRGRDVAYRLPVRVCEGCARGLNNSGIRRLLEQVPLYAQLLAKYPRARVSLARQ